MKNSTPKFLVIIFAILICAGQADAQVLDLSGTSASGTINNAIFSRTIIKGQGTGVLQPFVRIQENGSEKGYNTDGALEFDTKPGTWTHSVLLSDIGLASLDDLDYRVFLLDAGEPGQSQNTLSLDVLELYLLDDPDVTGYPANFPGGDRKYQLVDADHDSILLDNITGNGIADLYAYVPESYFTGDKPYLYLYSEFSSSGGTFEEWGTVAGKGNHVVPEPASALLLGSGLALGFLRKKKSA